MLAGGICGLIAQGVGPYDAAVAGAWLHGYAGLLAAEKAGQTYSVLAGDVIDSLALALKCVTGTNQNCAG